MIQRAPTNRDKATWLRRIDVNVALLDVLSLHGAVAVALRHPAMRSGETGHARARLALWRDLLAEVLVVEGGLTEAERVTAHAGLEDCGVLERVPWRIPIAPAPDTCRCWLTPHHPDDHHCPGDQDGHRMPAHGAHTWR